MLRSLCLIALVMAGAACASIGVRPVGSTVDTAPPKRPPIADDRARRIVPVGSAIDSERPTPPRLGRDRPEVLWESPSP